MENAGVSSERNAAREEGENAGESSARNAAVEDGQIEPEAEKRQKTEVGHIVASHYNKLEEKGIGHRKESRIYFMRNFNNWIKSMLIQDYISKIMASGVEGINVLDLGCGKGGDLMKWGKYPIRNFVGVDIAATSIEQAKQRYETMKNRKRGHNSTYTAEFYAADCTKTLTRDLYSEPDMTFDIVSCQFAFHYCFESYEQALTMLRNATSNLKVGGYFIGTTPCSYEIMSRLQKGNGKEFGNSVYNISFDEDQTGKTPALFGAQYNFHLEGVVDCPEFLVYFPLLEKLAERFGLMLIGKERFGNYFHKKRKSGKDALDLLGRMFALEPYPSEQLMGEKEQYLFAENEVKDSSETVGTLSSHEWEALNIYTIFAFKKMS
eukprot:TRINITY_DN1795_c0_g1_i2.p1 TRINITY_DN1795_c0_g1~~TRINITY_DN1795_c0_g1_i2.p1  ORF type:complete len:378 (-),score=82.01 TRINITY_DN1795_c0_g1_i2:174-1307(-)